MNQSHLHYVSRKTHLKSLKSLKDNCRAMLATHLGVTISTKYKH